MDLLNKSPYLFWYDVIRLTILTKYVRNTAIKVSTTIIWLVDSMWSAIHTITKLDETFLERVVGCFNWGLDESMFSLSWGRMGCPTIQTSIYNGYYEFSAFWYTKQCQMVVFFLRCTSKRFSIVIRHYNMFQRKKTSVIVFFLFVLYVGRCPIVRIY